MNWQKDISPKQCWNCIGPCCFTTQLLLSCFVVALAEFFKQPAEGGSAFKLVLLVQNVSFGAGLQLGWLTPLALSQPDLDIHLWPPWIIFDFSLGEIKALAAAQHQTSLIGYNGPVSWPTWIKQAHLRTQSFWRNKTVCWLTNIKFF